MDYFIVFLGYFFAVFTFKAAQKSQHAEFKNDDALSKGVDVASTLGGFSLVVLAVLTLEWWVPVVYFMVALAVVTLIVRVLTAHRLCTLTRPLGLLTLVICIAAWLQLSPSLFWSL